MPLNYRLSYEREKVINSKIVEDFAECFCGRLRDGRINYYLKNDGKCGFLANTIHSGIIWSREAVKELNICGDDKEVNSRKLLLIVTYVNILLEATDQIYRVLFNTSKCETFDWPKCFTSKPKQYIKLDDRDYFKELRSVFSAHPINLKEPESKTRRFADIPIKKSDYFEFPSFPLYNTDYDFSARIWTNTRKDEDTIYMPISISELYEFASRLTNRYSGFLKRLRLIAYHRDRL